MASTPIAPPAPAQAAPATPAPLPSAHNPTDVISNKLAAAMLAAMGPVVPPVVSPQPPAVPVPPAAVAPAVAAPVPVPDAASSGAAEPVVPAVVEPTGFNIDEVDFDNPHVEPAPGTPQAAPAGDAPKPLIPDATLEVQLADMLAKGDIPDKIEETFLRHSRGKQMLTSFKRDRELAKPVVEGGIGRVPTVDEVRAGDRANRVQLAMRDEFQNNPKSFVHNLLQVDPITGANYFGGLDQVRQVIDHIPQALHELAREGDPQMRAAYAELYGQYSAPVFNNFLSHQYSVALSMPQQTTEQAADKARILDALQVVEYRLFGSARPLNIGPNGQVAPAAGNGQPNPEMQALQSRLNQAEAQLRESSQQRMQGTVASVETQAETNCSTDTDTLIKTAGLHRVHGPEILEPIKNDLIRQAKGLMETHDPGGYQTYKIQLQQASRGQVDPSVPAKTYRQLYQNVLRGNPAIRERMSNLTKGALSSSAAQHQSLAQSQLRVEPNGSGTPAPSSVLPTTQITQLPGETREEFTTRKIIAASQAGMRR